MYAILADSGQQLRVEPGQQLEIDFRGLPAGEQITFDRVLAVSDSDGLRVGSPTVEGARVTAEVLGVRQGPKLVVQKFRKRKNSRRRTGHRQLYTQIKIQAIEVD